MKPLFLAAFATVFLFAVFESRATTSLARDQGQKCSMPYASFKYSYMDSLINSVAKPSDNNFISTSSNKMDVVKAQIYLWYVYRNPGISANFFRVVDIYKLLDRKEDAINSILWLIIKNKKFGGILTEDVRKNVVVRLSDWKNNYSKTNSQRNLVLDLYADDNYPLTKFAKAKSEFRGDDIDLVLRRAILSENAGNKLDALYYYTKVAELGHQGGLVGASILLPMIGGDACVSRASYYVRLSGAIEPVNWLERVAASK